MSEPLSDERLAEIRTRVGNLAESIRVHARDLEPRDWTWVNFYQRDIEPLLAEVERLRAAMAPRYIEPVPVPVSEDVRGIAREIMERDRVADNEWLRAQVAAMRPIVEDVANAPDAYNDARNRSNYCIYCGDDAEWRDEVEHAPDCPVTRARQIIQPTPEPTSKENA